jgi:hypothetical protein
MNQRQLRRYEQLNGITAFLTQHAAALGPELAASRRRLRALIADIDAIEVRDVNGSALYALRIAATARLTLRTKHLLPLSRQARRAFRGDPLVLDRVRVPHKHASSDEIAAAGAAMLEALEPFRAHLDAVHVDVARLDRLRAALDRFDALRERTAGAAPARRTAGRELQDTLARARADIVAIDATIRADHPELVEQWSTVMRMPKRRGRPPRRTRSTQRRPRP